MFNNFYQSAEIRWFWPGHSQWDALLTWFTRQDQLALVTEIETYIPQPDARPFVKQERPRTDEYLLLPNCDTVGVKQRQGRLEVKALVAGPRLFAQGEGAGRIEQWVKWSLQPSAEIALQLAADLQQSGLWRKVEKKRYTQKYAFDSERLAAVSPDAWPEAGCNVELTLLNVEAVSTAWMTLGLEAFGTSGRLMALLDEATQHFFTARGSAPLPLEERDSLSYPAWLAALR